MKNEIENIKIKELSKVIEGYNSLKQSFGKSKSQWQEANMALNCLTPIRNIRHLLARIERSYNACKETEYKLKKLNIRIQMKKELLHKEKDKLKKNLLNIQIAELENKISSALYYFKAAVKKIQHNYFCIEQILESKGYKTLEEIDFENQEEEYHIKTAINQSVRSVRISGRIDAGNQEYLEQCGINPAVVQKAIYDFLVKEEKEVRENLADKSIGRLYKFIDDLYFSLKGLSKKRSEALGVKKQFMTSVMFQIEQKKDLSNKHLQQKSV